MRRLSPYLALLLGPAAALIAGGSGPSGAARDPLATLGVRATAGASAGYVPDRTCQLCHRELYAGFQSVAMARSFSAARVSRLPAMASLERARFAHEPSGQHFEMTSSKDDLVFRRFQLDIHGRRTNVFETRVDWVLGSGNHALTFLYQTPSGELYQLPLAWYAENHAWGMAPGYDRPDHEGVLRRVRRECMFCHNAFPEVESGSDLYGRPPLYPASLPEGIGCQRCHGPGAEHVRRALASETTLEEVRGAILHPGKLPAARRDDICLGCHLQPSVALPGLRRFERADYSFRPGDALSDYLVQVDVDESGHARGERFEINHHPYRLRQSRCFVASGGALSCLTCHDPHRKVPASERVDHYRAACLSCHARAGSTFRHPEISGELTTADCTSCHMPARRSQDVVHAVMTDHRITRHVGGPELTAPRAESEPEIIGVELEAPATLPEGGAAELYRTLAVVRASRQTAALDHLARLLVEQRPAANTPYLDLADALIQGGRAPAAESLLRERLIATPGDVQLRERLGLAVAAQRRWADAEREIRRSLDGNDAGGFRPEARFNLGLALLAQDRASEAREQLELALAQRPNFGSAWFYLGLARSAQGEPAAAIEAFRRCLAIEPRHTRAYLGLAEALSTENRPRDAIALLRHALTAAGDRTRIEDALAKLESDP